MRVDYAALVRGRTVPGEVCEIVGGGPIPVSVAQRMLDDSFLKMLLVDGTDVRAASRIPVAPSPLGCARAVEERSPECDIEGCHVTTQPRDRPQPARRGARADRAVEPPPPVPHHHEHKHRHRLRLVGELGRMRFVPASEWVPP